MQTGIVKTEKNVQGISLVLAPLFLSASTFFWKDGEYTVTGSTLLIVSLFFWIPALTALFSLSKDKCPRYSAYGFLIAVFGCISGVCFAFLGYLTTIFNIGHQQYLEALSHYPVSSQVLLFASGPLFPLSIIVLGIVLIRINAVPVWQGLLLTLAGIAFPVSRILRMELIAHITDFLFLLSCLFISLRFFKRV